MLSINLSVLVLLLALALSCQQEAGQESVNQTETPAAAPTPLDVGREGTAEPGRVAPLASPTAPLTTNGTPTVTATLGAPATTPVLPVPPVTGRVMISGILAVAIGDPPGESGRARQAASLRDASGKLWRLVFDGSVLPAPASLFDWNLQRVKVEGMLTAEPDTVLVISIALAP